MQPPRDPGTRPSKTVRSPSSQPADPSAGSPRARSSRTGTAKDPETTRGQLADNTGGSTSQEPRSPKPKKTAGSSNRPSSTVTRGGKKTRQTPGITDTAVDGTAPNRTPNEPVKPVLKKTGEEKPITKSPGKPKRGPMRETREKSVTFLTEPNATAPTPPGPPVNFKPATITGFTELPPRDMFLIFGIWFMRFFIPWVYAWHNFNFYLLREPSFWDPLEQDIRTHEIIVFCVMSTITILVALFADLVNCKFFVFLGLLTSFTLCPLIGGILNSVLVARAYNQEYYRRWAFTTDILFQWALAIALLVTFPIQLSCIYDQNDAMSRQAHYNWAAFLVFLEACNHYIAFWKIPGKCPTKTFTQAVIWLALGVVISTVLLVHLNFTLSWAKPGLIRLKWQLQDSTNLKGQENTEVTSKLPKKFIWFLFILMSLIITSFVFAALERLYPDEDWDKHYVLSATSMFILGKIIGTALMAVTLSFVRRKLQYYFHSPFLRPDVLALGLPHVINIIALIALLGRYATLSNLKEGDVIVGPVPEEKKMVVEFYNFDFRNRTVCVHSKDFRPLKISPRGRGTREIYNISLAYNQPIHFSVTLDPKTTPGLQTNGSFQFQGDAWATFIIAIPFSQIFYSDAKAIYGKPEIIGVERTQSIRPKKTPQLYFMNTFVTDNSTKFMWMFRVRGSSGYEHEFKYNLRWQTVVIDVPKGHLEVVYHLANSTFPVQPVVTSIEVQDYSVWALLLGHARNMKLGEKNVPRMLKAYETMEVAGPHSRRLPSKTQLQKDLAIMAGMTLAGMASSGLFVGMIYLFWLDTPYLNYRTTCIGVFWVLFSTPVQLSKFKVFDISFSVIAVLTLLQIACTLIHFTCAPKLYSPKFNFRDRPD